MVVVVRTRSLSRLLAAAYRSSSEEEEEVELVGWPASSLKLSTSGFRSKCCTDAL